MRKLMPSGAKEGGAMTSRSIFEDNFQHIDFRGGGKNIQSIISC